MPPLSQCVFMFSPSFVRCLYYSQSYCPIVAALITYDKLNVLFRIVYHKIVLYLGCFKMFITMKLKHHH